MTIRPIFILLFEVCWLISTALLLRMIDKLRKEISEIWKMLGSLSNIAHENDETIRSIKSRLEVHVRQKGENPG